MNKKVLVFGGTGMVGQPVIEQLVADGHRVTALVRDIDKGRKLLPEATTLVCGDIENKESLHEPLVNTDTAVLIMPLSVGRSDDFIAERDGTKNIVDALSSSKRIEIVKLSEIGAGSDASFFDLQCKAQAEQTIKNSDHPFVLLRPTWFMEAWPQQLRVGHNFIVVGASRRRIHWVALCDMARWISNTVARFDVVQGKTLSVQGRDALSFAEAGKKMAVASGFGILQLPVNGVVPPGSSPELQRTLHELFRYYDRKTETFESEDLWRLLGEPHVNFETFVRQTAPTLID